jgi:hypothetical protein
MVADILFRQLGFISTPTMVNTIYNNDFLFYKNLTFKEWFKNMIGELVDLFSKKPSSRFISLNQYKIFK